jgi:hypothetical protein
LPTAPKRRPGQRVPESAQPSAATSDTRVVSSAETEQPDSEPDEMQDTVVAEPDPTPTGESDSAPSTASAETYGGPSTAVTEGESNETATEDGDHTGTRVFSPNEPVPSASGDGPPADPFADDDTAAEHHTGSSEPPTEPERQDADQDDGVSTPTSSTEADPVEEQTVVDDDLPTDATAAESATLDTNGSGSADESIATDPAATNRPVVPTFEAAPGDSDDESAETGTGASDARGPATPVLPRFEPVAEYTDGVDDAAATDTVAVTGVVLPRFESALEDSPAGDDTEQTVSREHVLPRFEAPATYRSNHADGAADRQEPKVLPVFEGIPDSEQSTTQPGDSHGQDQHADVLPTFETAAENGGTGNELVSATERIDTVITDRSDDGTSVDVGRDVATDTGEEPPADPEMIDCPSCGRSVRDSTDICYCPGCGTALER